MEEESARNSGLQDEVSFERKKLHPKMIYWNLWFWISYYWERAVLWKELGFWHQTFPILHAFQLRYLFNVYVILHCLISLNFSFLLCTIIGRPVIWNDQMRLHFKKHPTVCLVVPKCLSVKAKSLFPPLILFIPKSLPHHYLVLWTPRQGFQVGGYCKWLIHSSDICWQLVSQSGNAEDGIQYFKRHFISRVS